jgi:hypothetical protein
MEVPAQTQMAPVATAAVVMDSARPFRRAMTTVRTHAATIVTGHAQVAEPMRETTPRQLDHPTAT